MSKAKKYSLAISLTVLCLSLFFTPITKNAWPEDEKEIETLINNLNDENEGVRYTAAVALGNIGPAAEAAVPALIEALERENNKVRRQAAMALGKIGPEAKAAVPALIEALKDGSQYVRWAAKSALGNIGRAAVPTLIEALNDKDKSVRRDAAKALGKIGPEAKAAVPALIEALKDGSPYVRWAAKDALGNIGRAAVPDLIEALKDKDESVRRGAAGALGKIGPEAKPAVPALIEAIKDKNEDARKAAVWALEIIGLEAKVAVPHLMEVFKNKDKAVRNLAAMNLGKIGPEAKAAVPALIEALKDEDEGVRWHAARALGNIGSEAKAAVPTLFKALKDESEEVARAAAEAMEHIGRVEVRVLIEALKDKSAFVRRYAANALADIGPKAKAAVPALIEALKDEDEGVRWAAAVALGDIGSEAKAAVPALIESLKGEDENFHQGVAWTLGDIATALRDAKATDMIKDLKTAKEALSAYPEFREQEKEVGRAVEYLEQINPPWWENIPKWIFKNKFKSSLILAYLLWVIAWLIVFLLRPRALLRINHALSGLDFKLPDQIGGTALPVRVLLFVGFLSYRPRTLDAWVKKYILTCREKFSEKPTVYDRQIHINVPVEFDRQTIPDLTPKSLRPVFAKRISCLLIWGEGGSGKTSLACQIAKWAMAEDKDCRPCDHLMLPVLIEQELSSGKDQSAFIHAVGRQLQDVTDQANPIPDELLERLLRYQRILVIVDHLSEMNDQTRKLIDPAQIGFPVNALLVTSRLEENLGQVSKTAIKPLRVAGNHLSSFMEAYLRQSGKRDLFTDKEFFDGCGRLSEMVGERDITLFFAKLYAEQMISSKDGVTDEKLPDNIPDLMLNYLNELNRNVAAENKIEERTVHCDTKTLAWESIKETFRPGPIRFDEALVALAGEDAGARLTYLEDRLRLIKTDPITKDRISFDLDPLAEYLAGLYLLDLYAENKKSWDNFLVEADQKQGAPETIKGFLLAVRYCIFAKGEEAKVPDFVVDELAKRAGLDREP